MFCIVDATFLLCGADLCKMYKYPERECWPERGDMKPIYPGHMTRQR